jgi:hypothetical protein
MDIQDRKRGFLLNETGHLSSIGPSDRNGVALILVIGLLALMVVMGVTFSIFMRTERVAAGNFRNDVVARQLLHVALNRAIAAIDSDLGGKPYPVWTCLESGPVGGVVVRGVTSAPALDWIPRAALGSNTNPQPRWIEDLGTGLPNMIEARVGYLVVNCSGLLDVNNSGPGLPGVSRGVGTNVNEIQLSACPEVADAVILVSNRFYETIQELNTQQVGQASGALSQPVANFVSFSSFPTGYVGGTNITLYDLSGDETALMARRASILSGLRASGIEAGQEDFVFSNLLDYVDADNVPLDLGTACTESVPMFNEIVVSNAIVFRANGTFDIRYRIFAEWFYPFVKPSTNTYWIEYNVNFERVGSTPPAFPIPADRIGVVLDSLCVTGTVSALSPPGQQWLSCTLNNANYSAFTGAQVIVRAKISLKMRVNDASGPVVDAAPYPSTATLDFILSNGVPLVASALTTSVVRNAEVIDPRFNWDSSQWFQRSNFNTLYATNARTLLYLQSRDTDGYADMYVADRPLKTVSELTYLLRGGKMSGTQPWPLELDYWNTIRLHDSSSAVNPYRPVDRILDNFFIPTEGYGKGFVNPNSGMTSVLTAVFKDMPVSDFPDGPGFTLNADAAAGLAAFWENTNQNPWRCNFTNLSDIGRATNVFGAAPLAGLSPFQRESIFRNTAGLFNTRQQYFMILLFSQATKTVPQLTEKSVVAGARGIAEVWRDPLPNAEGVHPYTVRMFRVLNNE